MAKLPPDISRLFSAFLPPYLGILLVFILLSPLVANTMSWAESPVPPDDTVLRPGSAVNKELRGGQVHTYKIPVAAAGQYLRVVVEQHGINVIATLFDAQGKEVVRADNPAGSYGLIYLTTISQSAGDYRLEIRSTEAWANAGRYKISVDPLRAAKEQDNESVTAEKNYAAGRQLYEQRKYEEALKKYDAALSYWQRVGDPHWIVLIQYCLAVTHRSRDDRKTAATHFDKSIEVQVNEFDWRLRATAFNDRGANLARLGKEQQALESLNEAFKIYQAHHDRRGQASVFNNIGHLHLAYGRYREASDSFQKGVPLRRAENDRGGEAILVNNIGGSLDRVGEPRAALESYSKALQIWQELNSQGRLNNAISTLAAGFNNVAVAYDRLGEWQQALENYEKALALYGTPRPVAAANTLDNIGELYMVLGDSRSAMERYEEARALAEGKDATAESNALNHIGELYLSENKLTEALTRFEQTLALRKDDPGKANALTNIGAVYTLQGNPRKALESYNAALKLIEGGDDRRILASTLQKIGEAEARLNEPVKALDALNRALPIWRAIADKRSEANTLYTIALAERQRGNFAEALERSKQSLDIIESLRTRVASQRLRSSFFASQQSQYELYIDLRMRLYQNDKTPDHLAATFEKSEQSRARSLMDILTEARANIHRGININEDLVRREREIQLRLNDKARIQMDLLSGKYSKERAANIEREVELAIREYDAVKATIRVSSPDYAQLTQAQSLTLSEIQQLLDDDTVLLEYFLGEKRSYLWLVSRTSISGVASLPKRSEIENAALAFYKSLTQLSSQPTNGRALSQMLLGPVADRLGTKRLLIVGDGLLQYLPFAALPSTSGRVATSYLIEEHEIVYLPSASVLRVLRTETGERKPAPLSVAVLADPVFGADDERLKTSKQTPVPNKVTEQSSSSLNLRDKIWVPLPATAKEANEIVKAIPPPARKEIFSGFNASRATVLKLQDEGYRIVHFATHGDLNTEYPELSSIVLSLVDSRGEPQDGFLRLHDIYNLKLPADLIVLSACTTALGRIIRGEGLIGLTRGFMHAGAPRVIASLWRIEDLGTSELMKQFYHHLGKDRMSPALALRQAQVDLIRGRRWRSPYFWAGFVIQGEWRAIPIAQ